jgi:outer membrane protein TolC
LSFLSQQILHKIIPDHFKGDAMKPNWWCAARGYKALLVVLLFLLPTSLPAETIPLKRAVELALKHATAAGIAAADEQRAAAGFRELRDRYLPQLSTGSGLGWSYGFPLGLAGSAPSLFNLNSQFALLDPSLRNFMRAARAESGVASLRSKDQRNQIIQDTVLSYAELVKWEQRLSRLKETQPEVQALAAAVAERVKQGVDSEIEDTKARLSLARVRLRLAEAQGSADILREHLSKLIGLPASSIETDPDSIHALPASAGDETAPDQAAASSPAVRAAVEHARAQFLQAQGEHKALWPSVEFGAQYALLSKFNNYQNYYIPAKPCATNLGAQIPLCEANTFRQNNATIGVNIRIPIFNASQRARAQAADADALKAQKQAEAARNQVSEETLRLQRTVAQMQDARDVAELEYEIAQKNVEAVRTRMNAGTGNLHDLGDARAQASDRFIALQDVTLELERSQVELMRSTGDLEHWALGTN